MEQYSQTSEYAQVTTSIRRAKTVLCLAIFLALAAQVSAFIAVNFLGVQTDAPVWSQVLHWALPATKFIALVCSALLAMTMLFGVQMFILGRRPGLAAMLGAFYWSLALLTALAPWQQLGSFATGATFNVAQLDQWLKEEDSTLLDKVLLYARFIAYPALAMVVTVTIHFKVMLAGRPTAAYPVQTIINERLIQ